MHLKEKCRFLFPENTYLEPSLGREDRYRLHLSTTEWSETQWIVRSVEEGVEIKSLFVLSNWVYMWRFIPWKGLDEG